MAPARRFVADPKFGDVVRNLEARGLQAAPLTSTDFEVSWRNLAKTKFDALDPGQIVNHLEGAQALSHKGTLARTWFDDAEAREFYPRCYDLRDRRHSEALLVELARASAVRALAEAGVAEKDQEDESWAAACLEIVEGCPTQPGDFRWRAAFQQARRVPAALEARRRLALGAASPRRDALAGACYLVKPAGGSCGAGIACVDSARGIAAAAERVGWRAVVQKYVERPLLVRGRKFDLRQWVLITSTQPLVVYGFSRCYARFASKPWSLDDLDDRFAHLCNYSVQKDSPDESEGTPRGEDGFPPFQGNMWTCRDLAVYLDQVFQPGAFDDIVAPKIRAIAVAVARAAAAAGARKVARGFEWLGLDILVADDLSAWLLEANVSPDVSHSTPVTAALVPQAVDDAMALLLDQGAADPGRVPRSNAADLRPHPRWDLWACDHDSKASTVSVARDAESAFARYSAESAPVADIRALWANLYNTDSTEGVTQPRHDDDDDDDEL